jgi:hypothetical protein
MRPKPGCSHSTREASNHGSASKRKRAAPIRYSARTITDAGRIVEIAIGENLEKILACARSHHRKCGQATWAWRLKDGKTIIELPACKHPANIPSKHAAIGWQTVHSVC